MKGLAKNILIYKTLCELVKHRTSDKQIDNKNAAQFCFMLHDEKLDEIHKIELDDLNEWLSDGSFQKHDQLYISFLIKEN